MLYGLGKISSMIEELETRRSVSGEVSGFEVRIRKNGMTYDFILYRPDESEIVRHFKCRGNSVQVSCAALEEIEEALVEQVLQS